MMRVSIFDVLFKFHDYRGVEKRLNAATVSSAGLRSMGETNRQYEEVIGDRGVRLSGGQRQRICIAREIFRDKDILIFDEATSALDTKSEKLIQNSLKNMIGNKTLIIVAHRLSTLRLCDIIYVLDKENIIESGSWRELINNTNSAFYKMVNEQSSNNGNNI